MNAQHNNQVDAERTVATLPVNHSGYVSRYAMEVDSQRCGWLRTEAQVSTHYTPYCQMRIARHDDGLHVWAPRGTPFIAADRRDYPNDTAYELVTELHRWETTP